MYIKYVVMILILFLSFNLLAKKENYIIKFEKYNRAEIEPYQKKYNIKKYFSSSDKILLQLKERGEKLSNVKLADLRAYFIVELDKEEFMKLKSDNFIKNIYKSPIMAPRPSIDIEPKTDLFIEQQGYLYSFDTHYGVNAPYGWQFKGGTGKGITVVDNENGWILTHEDLDFQDATIYDNNGVNLTGTGGYSGTPEFFNHGTAVLGEIASKRNSYGTTGIAYNANIKVVSDYSNEYGYSTADAIIRILPYLEDGSIILLESQMAGPNYIGGDSQDGLVPDEWYDAEFDAIKTATANNIVIVEAGANGGEDLDAPLFSSCSGDSNLNPSNGNGVDGTAGDPCFNYETRDSGAIIVGAAYPPDYGVENVLRRFEYSSAGSRVNVQAWGYSIATTGYGDLFYPNEDNKQSYTSQFGGTSGASPIITGIIAQIQGRYKEKNDGAVLTPKQIRDLLQDTKYSHAQTGGLHIGPQPDIELIFKNYFNDTTPCNNECKVSCTEGVCDCSKNVDCNSGKFCNEDKFCEDSPCDPICGDWQTCDDTTLKCSLKDDKCEIGTCDEFFICNSDHFCERAPLCGGIYCDKFEVCNNDKCECIENYHSDNNICVENELCGENYCNEEQKCSDGKCISKVEKSDSCNYSNSSNNLFLFLFLFLFLIVTFRKSRERV